MKKHFALIAFTIIVVFAFPQFSLAVSDPDGFYRTDVKSNLAVTGIGDAQEEYKALVWFDGQNSSFLIDEPAADYGGVFSLRNRILKFDLEKKAYYPGIKTMIAARISELAAEKGKTISDLVFKKFQAGILPALIPRNALATEKIWVAGGGTVRANLNGKTKTLVFIYSEEITLREKMETEGAGLVGEDGGIVIVDDPDGLLDGVELIIPAGALAKPTVITIKEPLTPPPVPDGFIAGKAIELEPHGLVFSEPVELIIPSEGATERIFYVYDEIENAWFVLPTVYDEIIDSFVVTLEHFSLVASVVRLGCELSGTNCQYFKKCQIATYHIKPQNALGVSEEDFRNSIERALRTWENTLNFTLKFKATTEDEADLIFEWDSNNFLKTKACEREFGLTGMYWGQGKIRLNGNVNLGFFWTANSDLAADEVSIEEVALHEIGHALGLHHACPHAHSICPSTPGCTDPCKLGCQRGVNGNPIMAPSTVINQERPAYTSLFPDDVERIRNLYEVEEEPCPDSDADDFPDYFDCDNNNPDVYSDAPEICGDGIDNQCPGDEGYGEVDEECGIVETYTVWISVENYGGCSLCLGSVTPTGVVTVNRGENLTLVVDQGTCPGGWAAGTDELGNFPVIDSWGYGTVSYNVLFIPSDLHINIELLNCPPVHPNTNN